MPNDSIIGCTIGVRINDPDPKPAAVNPPASPFLSGNHLTDVEVAVPYPVPIPSPVIIP